MGRKEIFVEWDGPYNYNDVINCDKPVGDFAIKPSDMGLYQIYGSHPLYGENVLIYIGKTEDGKGFCKRLRNRGVIVDNKDTKNVQIYLGRIFYDDSSKDNALEISADIAKAESLIIHYHKPAHNSSNINSLKYADEDFVVINTGSYRSLHQEISTQAFTKELKIYAEIDEVAAKLGIKSIDNDEDSYGFYLNEEESLWFGVLYEQWYGDTRLVLSSNKELDATFIEYDEDEDEKYYYKAISGSVDEITKKVRIFNNVTN